MTQPDRLNAELAAQLQELAAAGLTRRRRALESPCGRLVAVDGKKVLNFASNDYLGLAGNREIAQAMADGALHGGPAAALRIWSAAIWRRTRCWNMKSPLSSAFPAP